MNFEKIQIHIKPFKSIHFYMVLIFRLLQDQSKFYNGFNISLYNLVKFLVIVRYLLVFYFVIGL